MYVTASKAFLIYFFAYLSAGAIPVVKDIEKVNNLKVKIRSGHQISKNQFKILPQSMQKRVIRTAKEGNEIL